MEDQLRAAGAIAEGDRVVNIGSQAPNVVAEPRPAGGLSSEDSRVKELCEAAGRGDEAQVRALLTSGVPANGAVKIFGDWRHPLTYAVKHPAIVRLLLDAGADVRAIDLGLTALHFATREGEFEVVDLLIERGAPMDQQTIGATPLHFAAGTEADRSEIMARMLRAGVDVDTSDDSFRRTPLHVAAYSGSLENVKFLLDAGANVNATTTDLGYTPLHLAAQRGYPENVRILLDAGANVNAAMYSGSLPLHIAAAESVEQRPGLPDVVRLLIAADSNLDAVDNQGRTPLHWAACKGQGEIAAILVEAGANTKKKDKTGRTPTQVSPGLPGLPALDWERILATRPHRGLFGHRT
jgi:ankyrin repeat protein